MGEVFTASLEQLKETLKVLMPMPGDKDYARILSTKTSAAVSGLSLGLKADENRLRARKHDVLDRLFDAFEAEKLKMQGRPLTIENVVPERQP